MKKDYEIFDGVEFPAGSKAPDAFRLLKSGRNELVKGGEAAVLNLTPDRCNEAVNFQAKKGEKIPIDSRHALFESARQAGLDEAEYLRQVPQGVAALGFGSLENRGNELWLADIEWTPLARKMFDNGQIRYFSPVIRGIDGASPFRVTSVAVDNVPALTNLNILAAGAEDPAMCHKHTKENKMFKKLEEALQKLFGEPALALGQEGEKEDEIVSKIMVHLDEIAALRAQLDELKTKVQEAEAMGAEYAAYKADTEAKEKTRAIDAAMAKGKVCEAQRKVLMGMAVAALGEFLAAAPENGAVPVGKADSSAEKKEELTPEEKELAMRFGITEDEFLAAKKAIASTEKGE